MRDLVLDAGSILIWIFFDEKSKSGIQNPESGI